MRVLVISPERAVFDGEAESLIAPTYDGQVGILPRHAPFMALLGQGVLSIRAAGSTSRFRVQGGFLQVVSNTVRVVAEHVQEGAHAA
ncbi:MAG TPA: ATP synthase F1 subunit epsilon [Gemmatimonadales bacterium]|jgi:F-type H+-transporting ATPase subunit epsilon|nr:ATP synthase F1 subunit epsilon [Gemmatimonadales bacterium]